MENDSILNSLKKIGSIFKRIQLIHIPDICSPVLQYKGRNINICTDEQGKNRAFINVLLFYLFSKL